MSEIKALENLREWSMRFDNLYVTDDGESYMVHSHRPFDDVKSCGECIRDACDEIQAEVDSRYMELPVDADGVPIRVGDNLECDDGKFLCNGIKLYHNRWWVMHDNDLSSSLWARCCHHVKPRTLENVLLEFGNRVCNSGHQWGLDAADVVPQYAAEIRELMGGDAE